MKHQPVGSRSAGTWIWQALSGMALLLLLLLHMLANHFVADGGLQSYQDVLRYLRNPAVAALELAFLVVVTYHALLGVRAIITDLGVSGPRMVWLLRLLMLLGVLMVAWGFYLTFTLAGAPHV